MLVQLQVLLWQVLVQLRVLLWQVLVQLRQVLQQEQRLLLFCHKRSKRKQPTERPRELIFS